MRRRKARFTTENTAFIRWWNAGLTFPNGVIELVNRNNQGMSAGYNRQRNTIILERTILSSISVSIGATTYPTFGIAGINTHGTMVGGISTNPKSITVHGLTRYFGGQGITLTFPGKRISRTFATAINDSGTIVGTVDGSVPNHAGVEHGFITLGGNGQSIFRMLQAQKLPIPCSWGLRTVESSLATLFLIPATSFQWFFSTKTASSK